MIQRVFILVVLVISVIACRQTATTPELITIDLNVEHPTKKLALQDFMNVEYVMLESNADYVTDGQVLAIGKKYIVVKNNVIDGNIYLFSRATGEAIRKINRKGKGPQEYTYIGNVVLDEEQNELFIDCVSTKKIYVYDLSGNFKRCFNHRDGVDCLNLFNYDSESLLCYDMSGYYKEGKERSKQSAFAIISKQDGSLMHSIDIPFDKYRSLAVCKDGMVAVSSIPAVVPNYSNWLLSEISSDTIYNYITTEKRLVPFLVKSPVQNPEKYITMGVVSNRYLFVLRVTKEFNTSTGRGFPRGVLMFDRVAQEWYSPQISNADFNLKRGVDLFSSPLNGEIAAYNKIDACDIVEARKKGELTGVLELLTKDLKDESNPVIMLMKNRR